MLKHMRAVDRSAGIGRYREALDNVPVLHASGESNRIPPVKRAYDGNPLEDKRWRGVEIPPGGGSIMSATVLHILARWTFFPQAKAPGAASGKDHSTHFRSTGITTSGR